MQDEGLRIAWQYRKYFGDERTSGAEHRGDTLRLLFHSFPCVLIVQHTKSIGVVSVLSG